MSVFLVQPPQVHQQRVESAAAAVLLGHPPRTKSVRIEAKFQNDDRPGELTGMLGIEMPEFATS